MAVIRASDARSWKACVRRAWYDHYPPSGWSPPEPEEFDQLTAQAGVEHEKSVLRRLEASHQVVTAHSEVHTVELMRQGAAVIYQPQLADGDLTGRPDFLIRLPSGDYQAADAKLKRSIDPKDSDDQPVIIQIGVYRRLLGNGATGRVFLGDGSEAEFGSETDAMTEDFLSSMVQQLGSRTPPAARHSADKCSKCAYHDLCLPEFTAKGDLTLLAGIVRKAAESLEKHGIQTIAELAATDPASIPAIPYFKEAIARHRAVLQARAYLEDRHFVVEPPALPAGTWVHFDIETNPLSPSGEDHIYLWGLLLPPYAAPDAFHAIWTDSEADDRTGWMAFLALMAELRQRYPDLVLAHYGHFERDKIALCARRYGMADHPVVAWLVGEQSPLFDLCKAVKRSLAVPTKGYGLKAICKHPNLVNFQWQDAGSGSQWSVVQYVRFLRSDDPAVRGRLKAEIIQYNLDGVKATRALESWLRSLPARMPEGLLDT
jgi:predicted RecB family nuclease